MGRTHPLSIASMRYTDAPESGSRMPEPTVANDSNPRHLPPILLADATWFGTLAAVRDLGSRGVPVTLASDAWLAPARASRYVSRSLPCPPTTEAEALLEWLLRFGRANPGHVLYPTSDNLAWLIAANEGTLAAWFRLFTPAIEALVQLLDKECMGRAALAAGLDVPDAWYPQDVAEVERLARTLRYPVFVKPRAHVLARSRGGAGKGVRVDGPGSLPAVWAAFRAGTTHHPEVLRRSPMADRPIIQACLQAEERVYTVDGFVDGEGALVGALACEKILQVPRKSGPGVCFDEVPVDPAVAAGLERLCRAVGFRGVFDAEFLVADGRRKLIDFNPRFYNHMAFEVDRGLPLPWMAYQAALGKDAAGGTAPVAAAAAAGASGRIYVHHSLTALLLAFQALAGAMAAEQQASVRRWIRNHRGHITDPALDRRDRLPGLMDLAMQAANLVRHPRAFFRDLLAGGGSAGADGGASEETHGGRP